MRAKTSSPGVSGHKYGQRRWSLTTRDRVRQETPGGHSVGTGSKGSAEKLRTGKAAKGGLLNLYIRNKCSD
jgi:hypothetical protein